MSLTTEPVRSVISIEGEVSSQQEQPSPSPQPSYPQAPRAGESLSGPPQLLANEVVDGLMERVRRDGLELVGEGGVLTQLTKIILERALEEERSDHLGYERGDPAGRGSGNSRNGTSAKRVLTELGPVDLDIPRDRAGTFEPQIVPKHTTRLGRFNDNIIAWYSRGLSTRDIRRELRRMYGVEVSAELIGSEAAGHDKVRVQAVHQAGDAAPDRAADGADRGQRAGVAVAR